MIHVVRAGCWLNGTHYKSKGTVNCAGSGLPEWNLTTKCGFNFLQQSVDGIQKKASLNQ